MGEGFFASWFAKGTFLGELLYRPLLNVLFFVYALLPIQDLGLAIIVLTILIRLLLLPSYLKSLRSSYKMKEIQPEMEKIQEKHEDDKEKQAEKMVELYQEHDVSPFGSCLPLLLQLPILFILYRVFRFGLNTDSLSLLYSFFPFEIANINTHFLHFLPWEFLQINLTEPSVVLAVLAALGQFWQVWLSQKTNPMSSGEGRSITSYAIYILPVITIVIGISLPAALALYWLVTTVMTALQQLYALHKFANPEPEDGSAGDQTNN